MELWPCQSKPGRLPLWCAEREAIAQNDALACARLVGAFKEIITISSLRLSSGLSASTGRRSRSTSVVLGPEGGEARWRELDAKVNEYPSQRLFKSIGRGGEDFAVAMRACVEGALGQRLADSQVSQRPSSKGSFLCVTIGPVTVETPDQACNCWGSVEWDRDGVMELGRWGRVWGGLMAAA